MIEITPLVTPLTDDARSVSEIRLARLVRKIVGFGVKQVFVLGDCGEFQSMSSSERKSIVEILSRESRGEITFEVNVSSQSSARSLDLAQHAVRNGARGVILGPPLGAYYTDAERIAHFKCVADFCNTQVTVVNVGNKVTPEDQRVLENIPSLRFAEGSNFDIWKTETSFCNLNNLISKWNDGSFASNWEIELERLVWKYGSAPVAKGFLDRMDFEAGSLRAPKLAIPYSEFNELFQKIA